jgi:tripartite-type tricarboxylate transporter receptor subunit TctC
MIRKMALTAATLGLLVPVAGLAAGAEDFFRGRTVTYIVATAAGGGYDGYGRLTARYMEKYLPGSTFVVVNRPGAGHLIGTNMIYAAKPDGLTLGTFNMGVMYSQLTGAKAAQYDLGKMSWIGKAASDKRVIMVGVATPYKKFEDLQAAKEPVPFAVSGVGSAAYTELRLLANVFDLNLKLLAGYSGNDDDMAIMRGEVVGKFGTISGQGGMVRDGRGRFVIQIGGSRETGYGEMSYGADVAKTPEQKAVIALIAAQAEMSRVTVGPPAIPADRLATLREAYTKAFRDPGLLADAKKLQYDIDPLVGEDMAKAIRAALDQPPRIIAMLKELQNAKPESVTVTSALSDVEGGGRKIAFKDAAGGQVTAEISGSRSKIQIGGKDASRSALKAGMTCAITYTGPGSEASVVACK